MFFSVWIIKQMQHLWTNALTKAAWRPIELQFSTQCPIAPIFFSLQDNSLVPEPWCLMVHRMLESAQSIQRMHNRYSFGHMISYEQPSYERKERYRIGVFVKVRSHSWVFVNFEHWYKFCPCEQGYSFKEIIRYISLFCKNL